MMRKIIFIVLCVLLLAFSTSADQVVGIGQPVIGESSGSTGKVFLGFLYDFPHITKVVTKPVTGVVTPPAKVVIKPPTISDIYVGNRLYHKDIVEKGDKFYVPKKVKIKAIVNAPDGIDKKMISMVLNEKGGASPSKTFQLADSNISSKSMKAAKIIKADIEQEVTDLGIGENTVVIKAGNSGGTTSQTLTLTAVSGQGVIGDVVVYPSPFSITKDGRAYIQYTLSVAANVDIYMTAVGGVVIRKISCFSGTEGGNVGRNKVEWDGRRDSGEMTGNGIYVGTLVSGGKILKKFKFTLKN
ncbi:MAG: hypothetical protein HQ564_00280 [Candidatus Saganbacteria bacterium]|nr:hypothetical protein [Candidatus Saganbacteria bacterium]